jgi:excisionase family DNA binding protein
VRASAADRYDSDRQSKLERRPNVNHVQTEWLTIREAATYTRCGAKTLYRAIHAGQLRAARVGGRRKFVVRREWLDAYLEACADIAPQEVVRLRRVA